MPKVERNEPEKTQEEMIKEAVEEAGGDLSGAQGQLTPEEIAEAYKIAQQIKEQEKSS